MATIKYFVPEDGDSEEHPNIFMLPKSKQTGFSPRLGDVKESFPLPGKYHFRFKTPLIPGTDREKGAVAVWMDCVDDNQHVGVWRNGIFAKVTRINMDDDDDDEDFAEYDNSNNHAHYMPQTSVTSPSQPSPKHKAAVVTQPVESDILGVFDDSVPAQQDPTPPSSSGNLLDHPSLAGNSQNNDLLNMGNSPQYSKSDGASVFLGMTADPVHTSPTRAAPVPVPAPAAPVSFTSQGQNKNPYSSTSFSQTGDFGGLAWK